MKTKLFFDALKHIGASILTVSPSNATNQAVNWSTSNPDVATVDSNGKVTAISVGTANITGNRRWKF